MQSTHLAKFSIIISLLLILSFPTTYAHDWKYHLTTLPNFLASVRLHEKNIMTLIDQKKQTSDRKRLKEIRNLLIKEYTSLQQSVDRLEKEKNHVRFEHPDEGEEIVKEYTYTLESVPVVEKEYGLDKRLSDLVSKIRSVYQPHRTKEYTKLAPTPTPTPVKATDRIKMEF